MSRLYYNQFTVNLDQFMANIFLELRIYYDSTICVGVGYQCDNIDFSLEMAQKFYNCYKTIFKSLCDFTNWRGTSALWLDECELSEDVTVSIYEFEPLPNSLSEYWKGGSTADTSDDGYCKDVSDFNLGDTGLGRYSMQLLFNTMTNYMGMALGETKTYKR